jgi:Mg2+/Co2+ transporter CorC
MEGGATTIVLILVLLAVIALADAGMTALARRRAPRDRRRPVIVALAQRDQARSRRLHARLRVALLALVLLLAAASASRGDALPVLFAASALAVLHVLDSHGRLRRLGARVPALGLVPATLLAPLLLMPKLARLPHASGAASDPDEQARRADALADELIVAPDDRREMVRSLLGLEDIVVDDIMVPRPDIVGIDLQDPWDDILEQLGRAPHTRVPLYDGELERVIGVLHMKQVAQALARGDLDRDRLATMAREREARFVPSGTSLQVQLGNFRGERRRLAFIVDEYGDVQGLVTLEDILEEIVGDFTTQPAMLHQAIHADGRGRYVIAGATPLRTINRKLGWQLPTDGPRTLSGAIIEYLEAIPSPGTALKLHGYQIEVLQIAENTVRTARLSPAPAGNDAAAPTAD